VTSNPGTKYLEAGWMGHMATLFLVFRGLSMPFSIMAVLIYIPIKNVQGFPSLPILANTFTFHLFNSNHSNTVVLIYLSLIFSDVEPKCLLTHEWMKAMWHTHRIEYYSLLKEKNV
jgi:hypothetical protein